MEENTLPYTAYDNTRRVRNWFRKIHAGEVPPEKFAKPRLKSGHLIFLDGRYTLSQEAINEFVTNDPLEGIKRDPNPAWPMPTSDGTWPFEDGENLSYSIDESISESERHLTHAPPEGELKPRELQSATTKTYARSDAVKSWVLDRAKGSCESCAEPAPFVSESDEPYLEVHHIKQLAHGGSDRVSNTVALCPNCHRQFHFGKDKSALKEKVLAAITELRSE